MFKRLGVMVGIVLMGLAVARCSACDLSGFLKGCGGGATPKSWASN